MSLFTLGLNHLSAPLSVRERLAFAADSLVPALQQLKASSQLNEAAIVSTCNRTEIVGVGAGGVTDAVREWLCDHHEVQERDIRDHLYAFSERETVRHTFRVAAGLDSMVLGEPQILGQMKQAFRTAEDAATAGPILSRLFQSAFRVAKQVRTETEVGLRPLSMAAAAARLATDIFAGLKNKNLLLIGAGDTAQLVAQHLHRLGPPRLTVANRSLTQAQNLANRFGGAACGLDAIAAQLGAADLIVATAGGGERLISREMSEAAFATRKRKPVLMIDLAVPRNIDPALAENEDVYLYSVDDFANLTQTNLLARQSAAADAEILIDAGTDAFMDWLGARDSAVVIRSLREHARSQAERALAEARRRLAAGDAPDAVLETLAHRLTNRLLHAPSRALRNADDDERDELAAQLQRLFDLRDRS